MILAITFLGFLKSLIMFFCWVSALLLTLVVLVQEPKGGGLASAFGGAGAETFGVQSGGVNKFTSYLAAFFLLMAVCYAAIRPEDAKAPSLRTPDSTIGAPADPDDDPADPDDDPADPAKKDNK